MRREKLGVVGVDSGQLMVMDPCYIERQWLRRDAAEPVALDFWGADAEALYTEMRSMAPEWRVLPVQAGHHYRVHNVPGDYENRAAAWDAAAEWVQQRTRPHGDLHVVSGLVRGGTYDQICDLTLSEKMGGQLKYAMGHDGLAVAFRSGLGDGVYSVYATYAKVPGWGERIVKVEIEMDLDLAKEGS